MRFLSLVLAILVLVLSSVACSDVHAASGGVATITETPAQNSHSDAGHTDCCSPFCQCACCGGFVLSPHAIELSAAPLPIAVIRHAAYYRASFREVSLPIWQPPQLG